MPAFTEAACTRLTGSNGNTGAATLQAPRRASRLRRELAAAMRLDRNSAARSMPVRALVCCMSHLPAVHEGLHRCMTGLVGDKQAFQMLAAVDQSLGTDDRP